MVIKNILPEFFKLLWRCNFVLHSGDKPNDCT